MNGYPVLLNLTHQRVVFVGGGRVAARKVDDVLAAGARVTIISPCLHSALILLRESGSVEHLAQPYAPGMLAALRPLLVFATTDSPQVNRAAAGEAESLGILVNAVDAGESRFSSMVTVQRPPITVALATGGASPALAAHLKGRLAAAVGEEYAAFARWLGDLRPLVKARFATQPERQAFWEAVMGSEALTLLRAGDSQAAYRVVENLLLERQPS